MSEMRAQYDEEFKKNVVKLSHSGPKSVKKVADDLGIRENLLNAVAYDLDEWYGHLTSKCKLFTDIDTAFIPAARIVPSGNLKKCLETYTKLGSEFIESFRSMLVFDAVIYNEDRHFGNFGVLRDNRSGKITAPAPLFDHGFSLLSRAIWNDSFNLDEYAAMRAPAFPFRFEAICSAVAGDDRASSFTG